MQRPYSFLCGWDKKINLVSSKNAYKAATYSYNFFEFLLQPFTCSRSRRDINTCISFFNQHCFGFSYDEQ